MSNSKSISFLNAAVVSNRKTQCRNTYHESIVKRSEDVSNGEVLITIGNLVLEGGNLLDGLLFLSGCLSLKKQRCSFD